MVIMIIIIIFTDWKSGEIPMCYFQPSSMPHCMPKYAQENEHIPFLKSPALNFQ